VTCAMLLRRSPRKSRRIARLDVPAAVHGTRLEIRGKNGEGRRPRTRCRSMIRREKAHGLWIRRSWLAPSTAAGRRRAAAGAQLRNTNKPFGAQ